MSESLTISKQLPDRFIRKPGCVVAVYKDFVVKQYRPKHKFAFVLEWLRNVLIKSIGSERLVSFSRFENEQLKIFMGNYGTQINHIHPIDILNTAKELLLCMRDLHVGGILHTDLKAANVLEKDGKIRLIDFGISVPNLGQTINPTICYTITHRPPEVFEKHIITANESLDMWAFGVTLMELLLPRYIFVRLGYVEHPYEYILLLFNMIRKNFEHAKDYAYYNKLILIDILNQYSYFEKIADIVNDYDRQGNLLCDNVVRQLLDNPQILDMIHDVFLYDPMKRLNATNLLEKYYGITKSGLSVTCIWDNLVTTDGSQSEILLTFSKLLYTAICDCNNYEDTKNRKQSIYLTLAMLRNKWDKRIREEIIYTYDFQSAMRLLELMEY